MGRCVIVDCVLCMKDSPVQLCSVYRCAVVCMGVSVRDCARACRARPANDSHESMCQVTAAMLWRVCLECFHVQGLSDKKSGRGYLSELRVSGLGERKPEDEDLAAYWSSFVKLFEQKSKSNIAHRGVSRSDFGHHHPTESGEVLKRLISLSSPSNWSSV